MKTSLIVACTIVGLAVSVCMPVSSAVAAEGPNFDVGDLPPDEAKVAPPSLFDSLSTGDVSPLGTPATKVPPEEMLTYAASFISGENGRTVNEKEAAFWLKRAVAVAPDPTGKRRAWALMRLGLIDYKTEGAQGRAAAQQIWELAAAWRDATAMCNLGALLEKGNDVSKADLKTAIVWYERGRAAGCKNADAALERLKR